MLTLDQVREAVEAIDRVMAVEDDDERAHALEDELHVKVLLSIAEGAPHAAGLAEEALKTRDIAFARWCA